MRSLIALGCALVLAACAGQPHQEQAEPAQTSAAEPDCLRDTGSHIRRTEDDPCVSAPGSVYSREDIDRTGAITTAEALRRLSPAVR